MLTCLPFGASRPSAERIGEPAIAEDAPPQTGGEDSYSDGIEELVVRVEAGLVVSRPDLGPLRGALGVRRQ
jgi:hypothetical protein